MYMQIGKFGTISGAKFLCTSQWFAPGRGYQTNPHDLESTSGKLQQKCQILWVFPTICASCSCMQLHENYALKWSQIWPLF